MSSVDNRIVELSFDNKDFEKNVQTSLGTLDKLKKGLNFEGASKGLTELSNSAKGFNLNPMANAVDAIKDRFSTLGIVGMTVIQNLTNKAVDFGSRTFGQVVSGGIKRALNFEQAEFQLEGLLGKTEDGAQKIQEIMDAANSAVSGTAYGLDEAAKVASQLVASGIKDGDKMEFILKGVAGTAAMTGSSYAEMGDIFTTVAGNGRLMTEQLRQFSHRGLNVAATLAEALDVTEQEVRDMVTHGEIDFETFSTAMAEAFGEHAQAANKTFTGSLSNVRAALSRLGAEVATPQLENLRDIFNVLAPLIDQVKKALMPFIEVLNTRLHDAAMWAVEGLTKLFKLFGGDTETLLKKIEYASDDAKEHIKGVLGDYTSLTDKVSESLGVVKDDMEDSSESISKSAEEIEEAAQKVIYGEYGNGEERRQQLEALGYSYEEVQNKVNELLGCEFRYEIESKEVAEATDTVAESTQTLKERVGTLNETLAQRTYWNFYIGIRNVIKAFKDFIGIAADAFTKVFRGRDFLIAIEGISSKFRELTNTFAPLGDTAEGTRKVFEIFFTVIKKLLQGLGKLVEFGLSFLTVISNLRNKVLQYIGSHKKLNGEIEESSRKQKFLEALRDVFIKIGEVLVDLKDKIVDAVQAVKKTEGFQKLKDTLEKLWEVIKEFAGSVIDKVIEKFNAFSNADVDFSWVDKAVELIGKGAGHLADFIQSFIDGTNPIQTFFGSFKDAVTGGFGKFVEKLGEAKKTIFEFFSGMNGDAEGTSENGGIVAWFRELFANTFNDAGEVLKGIDLSNFIEGIKTFFTNLLETAKDINWIEVGRQIEEITWALIKLWRAIAVLRLIRQVRSTLASASFMFTSIGTFFGGEHPKLSKAKLVLSIAILIGSIAAALMVISKIPMDDLKTSVVELLKVMGVAAGIIVVVNFMKLDAAKMNAFGMAMIGLGVGILALTVSAKLLTGMRWDEVIESAGKIGVLAGVIALAVRIAGTAKAAAAFMGLAVAIDLLMVAVVAIGHMKTSVIKKALVAIGVLALELGIAARIAGSVKAAAAFMGMAIAIDLLCVAIVALGNMDSKKVIQGAAAVVTIMLSLAAACRIAKGSKGAAVTLLAMTVPLIAAIVGLKVLAEIPTERLLAGALAIVAVMSSLIIAMKLSQNAQSGVLSFLELTVALGIAVIGLYALKDVPWETLLAGGVALSAIMLSLSAALKIAENANPKTALIVGLFSFTLIPVAYSLKMLAEFDWDSILAAGAALGMVLLSCAGAFRILAGLPISGIAEAAVGLGLGIDALIILVGGLTGLIGAFDEWSDGALMESVQRGGELLHAVGVAIGSFYGGIGEGIFNSLPAIADSISQFGQNLEPFFNSMGNINENVLSSVKSLAEAILYITAAELLEGIARFIPGSKSLVGFATELQAFAGPFVKFCDSVRGVDDDAVAKAANVAKAVGDMAGAASDIPNEGGFLAKLIGDNKINVWGRELAYFGPKFAEFADSIKDVKTDTVEKAAAAAKSLAAMAEDIPNQGGKLAELIGDNTLSTFGVELAKFGPKFALFAQWIKNVDSKTVETAAKAATMVAAFAKEIPNQGGALSFVIGDNTLSTFGVELAKFGPNFAAFLVAISGIKDTESVETATKAASTVAAFAKEIPNQGGKLAWLIGDNTLSKFGEELEAFGPHLKEFSNSLTGISNSNLRTVTNLIPSLVDMSVYVGNNSLSFADINIYGDALEYFGGKLKDYYLSIENINTSKISRVINTVYDLIGVGKAMSSVNTSSMESFGNALTNVGVNGVNDFISAFDNSHQAVQNAMQNLIAAAVDGLTYANYDFYNAGVDIVNGLINGINSNYYPLINAAQSVADSVTSSMRNFLGIHSPSRVMHEIGEYTIEGFIGGISDNLDGVARESKGIGNVVLDALSKPIDLLQNAINSEMEFEPVITPVLDLTNFGQGASQLGGMLGDTSLPLSVGGYNNQTVNTLTNLAAQIAASQSSSDNVVNAINSIREDLGTLGEAIMRMQVRIDGGALVGEIVDPLDQALGVRQAMKGRGV